MSSLPITADQPWHGHLFTYCRGQSDSHIKTGEDYPTRALIALWTMTPDDKPKSAGLAMIPSSYNDYDARSHEAQRARGSFVTLAADIDGGNHDADTVQEAVEAFAGGSAWLIYSSAHSRPGDTRWRIILPLLEAVPFDTWYDAQTALFCFLDARGIKTDRALSRAGQLVYLPNVPHAHKSGTALRGENGEPLYFERRGTQDAPGLDLGQGLVAEGMAALRRQRALDEQERAKLKAEADRRRAARPVGNGGSLIDDFNAANSIPDMLASCGYTQCPRHDEDWRSPQQTGETYATRVMGSKWVSLSGSDAASGLGEKCAAGCYGDAFDLFVHYQHGGNRKDALRQLGAERRADNVTYPPQFHAEPPEWMSEAPMPEEPDDYWQPDHGEDYLELAGAVPRSETGLLPYFDAGDFKGQPVTDREWMMDHWEPRRSCVYLTGVGAVGKSLFTQQRLTCSAAGLPFLGVPIRPGVSIYITCEDDLAEMHRRQDAINQSLGITWDDLKGRLFLISLKGMLNKELCVFDAEERMKPTERWASLNATIDHLEATHVALDNVAHFFTGNENIRNQVAAFVGLIDGLAERINGVVLLLGHPNKAGGEYSGSTAWENQVRARLFLSLNANDDGYIADPDARTLTNSKPNYSKRGDALTFRWHQWAFVRDEDLGPDRVAELNETIAASGANEAFLRCLRVRAGQDGREVGPKIGPSYAPSRFAEMIEARGYSKRDLAAAMERLLTIGKIVTEETFNPKSKRYHTVFREVL